MSESSDHPPDPSSLTQNATGTSSLAADSVVPSLMQVYNTMVQSKTPEGRGAAVAAPPPATHFPAAGAAPGSLTAAEWNAYTAATASGNTSLPSIPPPLDPSTFYAKEQENTTATHHGREKRAAATARSAVTSDSNATEASSNRRALRRKRSSPGALRENDDSDSPSVTSSSRGGSKSRRKAKDTDNRWSKRFSWPEDLHRDFVSAIFDVGLKHSSPSTILEHMPKHEQITSERVKSHLQKYRLHRIKSKKEFMTSYDAGLKKLNEGTLHGALAAGEVASLLTHRDMHEPPPDLQAAAEVPPSATQPHTVETDDGPPNGTKKSGAAGGDKSATTTTTSSSSNNNQNDVLTLPRLTEAEKQSPIGASMGYLMGLFFSLKQQLAAQRAAAKAAAVDQASKNEPVASVFDSFAGTGGPATTPATAGATASTSPSVPPTHAIAGSGGPPATVVSNPSTRSNLEENNMMKREMQSQMAFQNKMRGLKEQELNKFRTTSEDSTALSHHHPVTGSSPSAAADAIPATSATPNPMAVPLPNSPAAVHAQGAGDVEGGDRRGRGLSIGNADDFWNTDVMDEQLFEFLMSE